MLDQEKCNALHVALSKIYVQSKKSNKNCSLNVKANQDVVCSSTTNFICSTFLSGAGASRGWAGTLYVDPADF